MVTRIEQMMIDDGIAPSGYQMERYADSVLGEFVGFYAGRPRGSYAEIREDGTYIVFCGRVGGGNRDYYEDVWRDAYRHDWLVTAREDEGDSTYANFTFRVPEDRTKELWTLVPKPKEPTNDTD